MDSIKLNALKKIMKDISDLADLGEVNNDSQINFIAETMKVVTKAVTISNLIDRINEETN